VAKLRGSDGKQKESEREGKDGNASEWVERRINLFATNNNNINKKNTILKLARSRLREKQKAIYAGRQHC